MLVGFLHAEKQYTTSLHSSPNGNPTDFSILRSWIANRFSKSDDIQDERKTRMVAWLIGGVLDSRAMFLGIKSEKIQSLAVNPPRSYLLRARRRTPPAKELVSTDETRAAPKLSQETVCLGVLNSRERPIFVPLPGVALRTFR